MNSAACSSNFPFGDDEPVRASSVTDEVDSERFWARHEIDQLLKKATGLSALEDSLENPS